MSTTATRFTPEQDEALRQLETSIESHDHSAIGYNRRYQAARAVVHWYGRVKSLGVADALTVSELHRVLQSQTLLHL